MGLGFSGVVYFWGGFEFGGGGWGGFGGGFKWWFFIGSNDRD